MGLHVSSALLCAMLLLAGCGGAALSEQAQGDLLRHSFQLNVWDESLVGGGNADDFSFWVTPAADWVTVDIQVSRASNLSAFYFDLSYDARQLVPSGVQFTDRIALPADRLEQLDLGAQGRIVAGESIRSLGGAGRGFTGSGRLARVFFRRR